VQKSYQPAELINGREIHSRQHRADSDQHTARLFQFQTRADEPSAEIEQQRDRCDEDELQRGAEIVPEADDQNGS
jgi:hypothetical protein